MKLSSHIATFTTPLYLESGRILEPYQIAYETYGKLNADKSNVVVITHALSGGHHAAGWYEDDKKPGWWNGLIGPGKPVDTNHFFVICTNVLGSCFGSTGPISEIYPGKGRYRLKFPVITIKDMVKAQRILFDSLGIYNVQAIVGGSMGGMQALQFAIEYPNFAKVIIPMAATHATRPNVTASLKIMSEAIRHDPAFENGDYDPDSIREEGMNGLAIARMIGYLDFLSPNAMEQKFGRRYVETDGLYELFGRFEVERYLEYNGHNFHKWFDPLSYLYLLKALSIYDLSYSYESLDGALERINSRLELISFRGDTLFYPEEMEEVYNRMRAIGKGEQCSYLCVDSDYGHDAFLVQIEMFGDYVKEILER